MLSVIATLIPANNSAEVIPRLFIGNKYASKDQNFLQQNNISLIICASNNKDDVAHLNNANSPYNVVFIDGIDDIDFVDKGNIPAHDFVTSFRIYKKALRAANIMNAEWQSNNNSRILVHCSAGINRSALIIGIFMIRYLGYSYSNIIHLLSIANNKRSMLLPVLTNKMFRAMLIAT